MNIFKGSPKLFKPKQTTRQFIFYLIPLTLFSLSQMKIRLGIKAELVT